MQIVEVTDLAGLRVVVWPFRRRGTPLSFLLFRAVIRALWALGYRPGSGEWLTVFAILDR